MSSITIPDQQQRAQALNPASSFIVQAPAGSGKTELITQRYLKLLTTVKEPEEIVAITFTNKAVAEMQARIIQSLLKAQGEPPSKPHELNTYQLARAVLEHSKANNWSLLQNPQRLKISTIDSFCFKLTQQLPIASKFGTQLNISEDAYLLYAEASERVFELLNDHETWSKALFTLCLHLDNNLERIKTLLCSMLSKRDQWLPIITKHHQDNRLKEDLEAEFTFTNGRILKNLSAEIPASLNREMLAIIIYSSTHLSHKHRDYTELSQLTSLPEFISENTSLWQKIANLFLSSDATWRKQASAQLGFPAANSAECEQDKALFAEWKKRYKQLMQNLAEHPKLLTAFQQTQQLPSAHYTEIQWEVLNALLTLLPVAAAELRLLFIQQGVVDYIENSQAALLALGDADNPSDLALVLDHQIQHMLIDEFQDTSLSQFKLLEGLTAGWETNDGRSLFLVGDPMQSIYRFRQAEVGLFLQAQHHGIGNIQLTPLSLSANFRSTQNIIHWVNETFKLAFPEQEDISSGVVTYKSSAAIQASTEDSFIDCYTSIDDGSRTAEAEQICTLLKTIKTNHPNDSIAILVRSRDHLTHITTALKSTDLNYQAVEIERLAKRQIIQDLTALTKAILHLSDRISWFAILRAPWCGLTLNDLMIIANIEATNRTIWNNLNCSDLFSQLSQDGQQRVKHLIHAITPAIEQRQRHSMRDCIESTWLLLKGDQSLIDSHARININSYFDLLTSIEDQYHTITHELLDKKVMQFFATSETKKGNPIQLMTIHKSKGLEFDHVFLPCLDKRPIASEKQLLI